MKGITQASIPVGFIPRGKRRLKGIADPILVYAVTRDMTARATRALPRLVVLGAAGAAIAVAVVFAVLAASQFLGKTAASPPASAAPSVPGAPAAQPVVIGPLPIGTYTSRDFQPLLTFDIADQDWTATRDRAEILGLIREAAPRGSVYFLRVSQVIANPCVEGGEGGAHTGPADLLVELASLEHLELTNQQPAEVGGRTGQQVDVTVSDGVLAACGGLVGGEAAIFAAGEETWSAASGERFRLISVGAGDQAVTIFLSTDWTQTPSIQELENLLQIGHSLLDSVEFDT